MLYQNVRLFSHYLRFIDAATLVVGPLALEVLHVPASLWERVPLAELSCLLGVAALAFLVISRRLRTYYVRRAETLQHELIALVEVSVLALAVACLVVEVALGGVPGEVYAVVSLSGTSLLLGTRTLIRLLLRRLRARGRDYRRWLLVGRTPRAVRIAKQVLEHPHYGIQITAVVDAPGNGTDVGAAFREAPLSGLRQYEDLSREFLSELMIQHAVDEVVVALPMRQFYDEIEVVMQQCAEAGIPVKTPTRTFECVSDQNDVVFLGAIPLVTHYSGPVKTLSMTAKRMLDIAVSCACLILLLPVMVIIAVAVKLTSKGPLLFGQTRIGLHSRPFTMYKFRTMIDGAAERQSQLRGLNERDGPAFKLRNDPRVTRVGRFLRRHHLDELPQFWNVFMGDMSLVGPRPLAPDETNGSEWWQRRRLSMQPGLTCLWQVRNDGDMPFDRWMELDLEYIDRWSLWLDVRLLVGTLGTVVRGRGC